MWNNNNNKKKQKEKVDSSVCFTEELDYFGASLLWNMLAGKDLIRVGEGPIRTGQNVSWHLIV